MLRPLLALVACLLLSCGSTEPPPGEWIGTFAFRSTLVPPDEGGCPWPDSPDRLDFEGTVSWEPEAGTVWLTIGDVIREGALDGNRFDASLPGERAVPRKLRSCDCEMEFRERFDLSLVDDPAFSCIELPILVAPAEKRLAAPADDGERAERASCPQILDDGTVDWGSCGGLCGHLVEAVTAPPGCMCTWEGVSRPAPPRCEIRYKVRAMRVGGRT